MDHSIISAEEKASFGILIRILVKVSPTWVPGMADIAHPRLSKVGGEMVLHPGLAQAPAAKRNHHAEEGGLVRHCLEMWRIHKNGVMEGFDVSPLITDERVLRGIILHDLHKAFLQFVWNDKDDAETTFLYSKTDFNGMLTNDQRSAYVAQSIGWELDVIQLNALYHSEGGYARNPPDACTTLSKYLYLLDEWSGNVDHRIARGEEHMLKFGKGQAEIYIPDVVEKCK